MLNVVNPNNALAFYKYNHDLLKRCPIYCPNTLLSFQIPVSGTDDNFSFKIVDLLGNENTPTAGTLVDEAFTDGSRYITFNASSTTQISSQGIYQLKFESDEVEYWSNAICVSDIFETPGVTLSCTGDSGTFVMTLTATGKADYTILQIDFDGTGLQAWGQDEASFDISDIGPGLSFDLPVKVTHVYANYYIERSYTLSYTASDPCGTKTLTLNSSYSSGDFNAVYVEYWNANDVSEKGLIFQSGYKMRVYFTAEMSYPGRVVEESFITLYDNATKLASSAEATQLSIDFYPMAEHLLGALGQARAFDNCNLVDAHTGESQALGNFRLSARDVQGGPCQAATITAEIDRSYIKSSEDDKTPA